MRYHGYLEQEKAQKEQMKKAQKRSAVEAELDECLAKKLRVETTITSLLEEADKLARKAETRNDFRLLTSSNGLRDKANNMKKEVPKIEKNITDLKAKL